MIIVIALASIFQSYKTSVCDGFKSYILSNEMRNFMRTILRRCLKQIPFPLILKTYVGFCVCDPSTDDSCCSDLVRFAAPKYNKQCLSNKC